ncbi:wax ester/triacylglycerol synthase family O-acyltransferase [Catellatospora sp. KI3]|uniref:wax ester/triacylglycerol synthase family O-acyltransferase n=1 Tax=Catellatospora sp. KI3 TaxID=3041620 RepID=UPI0024821D97|nr:wax ester/triacylglycerol synthase family O-acyltransferase [Catellatospora sp. KI3]MDI1465314.1 wax ester/triacylglycerol synthase family O-acyltransferase [Catellatospora sp. KI3]
MPMEDARLSALDLSFLCLENSASPMHLGAVAVFRPDAGASAAEVVSLLTERARQVPRMRRRVVPTALPPGGAAWAEDPEFDARAHVHHHELPGGGREDLAALVAEVMAAPLDRDRPLWELHVVSGLDGGRFGLLAKMHHAMCDGQGAIGIGLALLDGGLSLPSARAAARRTAARPSGLVGRSGQLLGGAIGAAAGAYGTASGLLGQATRAFDIVSAVLGTMRAPAPSPLLAPPSGTRRAAFVGLEVRELQRIRRVVGGTMNDVLLAVVAGALRHWLATHGRHLPALRALVPASQRARSGGSEDGNQLSAYLCELPVGEDDPVERARRVRAEMETNKARGPLRGAGAIPVLAGVLPPALHRLAAPLAAHAAPLLFDLVVTSVPLPPLPLRLGGAELEELYPIAPLASGHTLAVGMSRYRDTVHIGLYADGAALPDLEKISEALPRAVAELLEAAGH